MEYLIGFIGTGTFWLLMLIVTYLLNKKLRLGGVIILLVLIFTDGEIPFWLLLIVSFISIFTTYLEPYRFFKRRYEKKIDRFYDTRRITLRKDLQEENEDE